MPFPFPRDSCTMFSFDVEFETPEWSVAAIGIVVRRIEATGDVKRARAIARYSMWLLPVTIAIVLCTATLVLWI